MKFINIKNDFVFLLCCAFIFAGLSIFLPPYYPLLAPDSQGYINFSSSRTALYPILLRLLAGAGLSLEQITYVQLGLLSLSLIVMLSALLRVGVPRWIVILFTFALGANVGFSTFYRAILTEPLYFTVTMVALAFWLDYLRTGRAIFLILIGLGVGLLIGVRPAGIALLPMLPLSVWLKWPTRNVSASILVVALVLPTLTGVLTEQVLFRAEHGSQRDSILPNLLVGRAAMVVGPTSKFSGTHAELFSRLAAKLNSDFEPVRDFLSGMPLLARPVLVATYEGFAQFQALRPELAEAARTTGIPVERLESEFGEQVILSNLPRYIGLSLTHYLGQWSITALTFPPTAHALDRYVTNYPSVPFEGALSPVTLHPPAHLSSYVVYPAFIVLGIATLILSAFLIPFLLNPSRSDTPGMQYLCLAAFFSAMCQVDTVFLSLVNVSTPRFLMAVYPQLGFVVIFGAMAFTTLWRESKVQTRQP
jgi:hypothetical protein